MQIVPIILGGGAGTRLWPITQSNRAKPLLELPSGNSMLFETFKRAEKLFDLNSPGPAENQIIITMNQANSAGVEREASSVFSCDTEKDFFVEPIACDTAPIIVLSALHLKQAGLGDAMMFVMPADHCLNKDGFLSAAKDAIQIAGNEHLVSIGAKATQPNTRFGYMKLEQGVIKEFIEKPNLSLAVEFCSSGHYVWNTGIFCCTVDKFLDLLAHHCAGLLNQCQRVLLNSQIETDRLDKKIHLNSVQLKKITPISIDHALMMKLSSARCVVSDMNWSDVGSWDAYGDLFEKDLNGNICFESGFAEETQNCFAYGETRPIAMLGISDLIIVDTEEGVLVANKSHAQKVKQLRERFRKRKHNRTSNPLQTETRPWGRYEVLSEKEGYKVKRLIVEPNQALSLQSHQYRAEHWMIVEGSAKVQLGTKIFVLNKNEHIDIPCGAKHRITNPHKDRLVFIETQTGTYFGEDDEIRYEDRYGRVN